ncbi:hypothetical protein [Microvirga aerophila]|uniref:Uncharacterized protein n=1 Tax=Microvirga aerophila TaxID=670291 RepID=A0A512BQS3_9HYPH|nr:hypothetical protein [Microvirga aerophila]GEO14281.1 hypothetical protein MAE02_19770 [Microvirga aerophila]
MAKFETDCSCLTSVHQRRAMDPDQLFPINLCDGRLKHAILSEFAGRCPTIRDVRNIPDSTWLAVPGVGPTNLAKIRYLATGAPNRVSPRGTSHRLATLPTGELLSRLTTLQAEINCVADEIWVRITPPEQVNEAQLDAQAS